MNPTHFVYQAFKKQETNENQKQGQCCFCGESAYSVLVKKEYILDSFTNIDYLRNPSSKHICEACAFSLGRNFTRKSFVCTASQFIPLEREQIAEAIFNLNLKEPFIVGVTRSYKKHLIFKCKINNNLDKFYIQLDDCGIIFEPKKHIAYFQAVEELYNLLHSCGVKCKGLKYKNRIIQGEYDLRQIKAIGVDKFYSLENKIKSIRPGELLELLVCVANNKQVKEEVIENNNLEERKEGNEEVIQENNLNECKKEVKEKCLQKKNKKNIEQEQLSFF